MVASFVGDVLVAFALLHFVLWSEANTFATGAFVGFICWFGFIAATQFLQGIYERRPKKLLLINSGYWFVVLLIVGGVLAV